jgi:hypothetical protein
MVTLDVGHRRSPLNGLRMISRYVQSANLYLVCLGLGKIADPT